MEQVGFVKRVINDKAELEVKRASGCGNCNGCAGGCEVKSHYVVLKNRLDAKVGDFVELKGEPKSILKYMFILYMIPFIFLVAGIIIGDSYFKSNGYASYELLSFASGMVSLFISFFIVKIIDKRIAKSNKETIVMTRIL
jgi:sigma-E factor negative regulatory protein RseC